MGERQTEKTPPLIKWQKPMVRVVAALTPAVIASIYFFGWRSLLVLLVVNVAGFFSEYAFARYYREPVSSSIFVTNVLFALILPPNLPLGMAIVGIVFGVVFGKMVFGGFGKNVFNPALVGRAFIYINFAVPMTGRWYQPFSGALGGLSKFTVDAVTTATPMGVMKAGGDVPWTELLFGRTSGCLGETSAVLLVAGGAYLLWTKTANRVIVFSCVAAMLVLQTILWSSGVNEAIQPIRALLSGGFLLGAFFMATDPVSACQTKTGKWIYGAVIGGLTVVIRTFSVWAEGVMFAVLLANMFGPIIDHGVKELKSGKK